MSYVLAILGLGVVCASWYLLHWLDAEEDPKSCDGCSGCD